MTTPTPYTATKTFDNFPCSHRAWRHTGHCRFVHGYSRSYTLTFACTTLSDVGFVVDFGQLGALKQWLDHWFDHTCLVSDDDPELDTFHDLHTRGVVDLRVMPGVSMEASARFVWEHADALVREQTDGRAWCVSVEARENNKNAATYAPPQELT